MKSKLYVFLLFIVGLFCFNNKVYAGEYYYLPGGEIAVPTGEYFTCIYDSYYDGHRQYPSAVAVTFESSSTAYVDIFNYGGKAPTITSAEAFQDPNLFDDYTEEGISVKLEYNTGNRSYIRKQFGDSSRKLLFKDVNAIQGKDEDYLQIRNSSVNTYPISLSILEGSGFSKDDLSNSNDISACPSYLYIFEASDVTSETGEINMAVVLSNKPADGRNTEAILGENGINIKNKKTFQWDRHEKSDSEKQYIQKYCKESNGKLSCNVGNSEDNTDDTYYKPGSNENLDDYIDDKTFSINTVCKYKTQFVATSKDNAEFNGLACLDKTFDLYFTFEDNSLQSLRFNTNGFNFFTSGTSHPLYCAKNVINQECKSPGGSFWAGKELNYFLDENQKCYDKLYWNVTDNYSIYVFPNEEDYEKYYGHAHESWMAPYNGVYRYEALLYEAQYGDEKSTKFDVETQCPLPKDQADHLTDVEYNPTDMIIKVDCEMLGELSEWLSMVFTIIQVGAVILTIILTGVDVMKSIASSEEKNQKQFFKRLLYRLLALALLFLLRSIILFLLNLFGIGNGNNSFCFKL